MEVSTFERRWGRIMALALAFSLVSCGHALTPNLPLNGSASSPNPSGTAPAADSQTGLSQLIAQGDVTPNCVAQAGHAACGSFLVSAKGQQAAASGTLALKRRTKDATSSPSSNMFTPAQLQAAYGLTSASSSMGAGRTVAAVVAYDNPDVESDLGVYRSTFGLDACTTANGCFRKVDQRGGTNYPAQRTEGWGCEMVLDVSMISALCPKCRILLVEADSDSFSDLANAVNTAVSLGASVVNNSYGIQETGMGSYASYYDHPGIPIVAAAGNGTGSASGNWQGFSTVQNVPAAYNTVIAAGESYIQPESNARGYGEYTYWNSSSGCSSLVAKPSWQHDSLCSTRTVADIAFGTSCVQTPYYGFYDSAVGGWVMTCGSSAASAAISAIAGLAGTVADNASFLYTNASSLNDILYGTNGAVDSSGMCTIPTTANGGVQYFSDGRRNMDAGDLPHALCNSQSGYDAPTGNGSPNGITAFTTPCLTPSPTPSETPFVHPTQNPSASPCTS